MVKQEIIDQSTGEIIPVNITEDKALVVHSFSEIVQQVITQAQFSILSGKTPKSVIKFRPGKGGKTFAYIPHGYIVAVLNRAFGLDWSFEILPYGNGDYFKYMAGVKGTTPDGKPSNHPGSVLVHGRLTVRVRDPKDPTRVIAEISKTSTGEKEEVNGMTWGGMVKSAESDALKKCATRLGVGNDLYYAEPDDVVPDLPPVPGITAEQLTMARDIKASGKNYSQVAAILTEKFGVEITREQVIEALG